ncbi:Response regulator receiver domain [Solimicrobium silvestre]|uniref:Response regulator receiver domain n=1 Tax=Solimicrobium silvestre TaxID=2099400 RepID=A0A2S9GTN7_9BURK|nr:Response regulator receiver domain [Solimicrobium silvestre]
MQNIILPLLSIPENQPHQSTLLYVEDNPANLLLVERLISRRSDIKLLTATNGGAGIKIARNHRPNMIILDISSVPTFLIGETSVLVDFHHQINLIAA